MWSDDASGDTSIPLLHRLHCDGKRQSDVRISAVVQVISVVIIDVNVVSHIPIVCPVLRPRVHQQESKASVFEAWIPHVDCGETVHPEPVLPSEIQTEAVLGDVITPIAAALRPGAMVAFPPLGAILLKCAAPLQGTVLFPPTLLLPCNSLVARTLGLPLLPGLLPWLLRLRGLRALLLRWVHLLLRALRLLPFRLRWPRLLGLLLRRLPLGLLLPGLLGRLLRWWSGSSTPLFLRCPPRLPAILLLRLSLRAPFLIGRPRTALRLALLVLLRILLRVRRNDRPEKQAENACADSSTEFHRIHLR